MRAFPGSHCVKSVRIRSYSGPHFPAFGLNTERNFLRSVPVHIASIDAIYPFRIIDAKACATR